MATYKDDDSLIFHETPNELIHQSSPTAFRLRVWPQYISIKSILKRDDSGGICIAIEDWNSIKKYVDEQLNFSNR